MDNGWLADYRIIALAVNDPEAYKQANLLASGTELKGRKGNNQHSISAWAGLRARDGWRDSGW